ncbi:hypothetical protein HD806DRAFT_521218 [Xylariaceae sp. AK1471]|nr:hypothetical protein HD806DRAFT_521218 [Xylariaceae sp. AK1471]
MGRTLGLHDLVREVVGVIQEVDEHVLGSNYIKHDYLDRVMGIKGYVCTYSDPEAHLENFEIIHYWEKYFEFVLQEWNLDVDGERMSESQFNFIIERLTTSASQLDHYGPQLVSMYQDIPNVPEKRIQGIIRRRTVLNGFLNSAEIGLEHYYRLLKEQDFAATATFAGDRPN